ncbi:hypothetical protein Tco_0441880 [Tanacetum coccineum]
MEDGIFFNQSKYIKEMLKKFGLEDSKPTKMSMSTEIKLTKDNEADSVDSSKCQGKMDDLNITIEEYIRLEEEKARRHGRTFNWQTATFGKSEPMVCSPNKNEQDFRISLDGSDDEDYTGTITKLNPKSPNTKIKQQASKTSNEIPHGILLMDNLQASNSFFVDERVTWIDIEGIPFKRLHITPNVDGESDLKEVAETIFEKEQASVEVKEGCNSVQKETRSEDPFNIYDLLDMKKEDTMELAQKREIKYGRSRRRKFEKYYHGVLNKKRNQLAIRGILVEGRWVESPILVKDEFLFYFASHFNKPPDYRLHIDLDFPDKLSLEQQMVLEIEVTREEIKKAVWDCGVDKSHGPDGFTSGFYRRYWSFLENDVVEAVLYFFNHGQFPKGSNSSFITLIPKTQEAKMVKDFRPITLIGSLYNIIAKILANRLVVVLEDLVGRCFIQLCG